MQRLEIQGQSKKSIFGSQCQTILTKPLRTNIFMQILGDERGIFF